MEKNNKRTSLMTIAATKLAIDNAKVVYIQARFGVSEYWLKITKREAYSLLDTFDPKITPKHAEMPTSCFGEFDGRSVFLG
jgi:hypothetical protein